jgi:hypothetical protein
VKAIFANGFRVVLIAALSLTLSPLVLAQHGGGGGGHGGGGHGGGHFGGGRFGGRGHSGRTGFNPRAGRRGFTRHAPFGAFRFFGRHGHHRRFREPFVFGNGFFYGAFLDCGFWDWNCDYWDDSYFNSGDGPLLAPPPNPPAITAAPQTVTLLYLKDGYTIGATDYWFENDEVHYRTTYGGENAVRLTGIDLPRTIRENASRGVPFKLYPKPFPPAW